MSDYIPPCEDPAVVLHDLVAGHSLSPHCDHMTWTWSFPSGGLAKEVLPALCQPLPSMGQLPPALPHPLSPGAAHIALFASWAPSLDPVSPEEGLPASVDLAPLPVSTLCRVLAGYRCLLVGGGWRCSGGSVTLLPGASFCAYLISDPILSDITLPIYA